MQDAQHYLFIWMTGRSSAGEVLGPGTNRGRDIDVQVLQWFEKAGVDWTIVDARSRTFLHILSRHDNGRDYTRFKYLSKERDQLAEAKRILMGQHTLDYAEQNGCEGM